MPAPLVIAGIAAGVAVIAGGVALAALKGQVANKSVLIVGPSQAGKSTLHDALTRETWSHGELGRSSHTHDFVQGKVKMSQLPWTVSITDTPSSTAKRHELISRAQDVDLIVFVADASVMLRDTYRAKTEDFARDLLVNAPHPKYQLVLSHGDKVDLAQAREPCDKVKDLMDAPEVAPTCLHDREALSHVVRDVLGALQ